MMSDRKSSDNIKTAIIHASRQDLSQIVRLEASIEKPCLFSRSQLRYLLSSPNAFVFLCHADGSVVGYGIALKNKLRNGLYKGRIYFIGVIPEYQFLGIGTLLLKSMENDLIKTGVSFIVLETKSDKDGAESFFKKHGYIKSEILPDYYASGDAVKMKKIITAG